ncbi:hypothetical protein [uncultured Shimia sp.]|uniref:hypothetical protein n=1 Tax=uncultured Shimia sp. TaxID=573152 RepID=UPI002632A91B|nr:hypothetical protein [uncultured Shimia sp.]
MSKFTAPTGESPLDQDVAEVRRLLRSMRVALAELRDRLEQDETSVGGQLGKVLTELRHMIRTTMDTESRFEERRKQKAGIVHEYRLDLDAARATIQCRLVSLRNARNSDVVSGQSE